MKSLFSIAAFALAASTAQAAVYQPTGSNLTLGDVSNSQSIISDITNPAASAMALEGQGSIFHMGILSNIGLGLEFGRVDDVFNLIDEKARDYSNGLNISVPALPTDLNDAAQVNQFLTDLQQTIDTQVDDLNSVLTAVATDGYGKAFASMNLPLMPVVVGNGFLGGSLVFDINGSVTTKAVGLNDNIDIDYAAVQAQLLSGATDLNLGEVSLDLNTQTLTINNDTTLLTRAAGVSEFALGYSRQLMKRDSGVLLGGLRAKYYKVGLTRVATRLGSVTDAEQLFQDIRDAEFSYDNNFGIDLGVLWVSEHYRLGVTATNLNEPGFTFPALDVSSYQPGGAIANQLGQEYVYTMTRQLKLEGSLYTANRKWVISGGLDANAAADPMGDDYQWATISAAYLTDSWLMPGGRVGYRSNLAGEALNYVTLGATLFRIFNIDLAMSLENVTIDGTTVPRGAMINMGLALTF